MPAGRTLPDSGKPADGAQQGGAATTRGAPDRILVIDDNASVLETFRKILAPADMSSGEFAHLGSVLFGSTAIAPIKRPKFQLDLVSDGEAGRDHVASARTSGQPYALAFVDMRMPGWDGLTTATALWQADPDLQIVICTAYSDYAWDEVVSRLGCSDRWLILKKPFEMIEVLQMAWALTDKWRLQRLQRRQVDTLEQQVGTRVIELQRANHSLLMLSRCHDALVRSRSEPELLDAICRRIVESGHYAMAWVGFAENGEAQSLLPAAYAGNNDAYPDFCQFAGLDGESGRSPEAEAFRTVTVVASKRIAGDPGFAVWRAAASQCGLASALALPLRTDSGVFGSIGIYSSRPDAFDDDEVQFLQELAEDLAYGIANLRQTEAREQAESKLEYHANYDALTGLPNRSLFRDRAHQAIVYATRAERQVAVLLLSLDRFQAIRNALGDDTCNALLKAIGERLSGCLRAGDTVAHLAADEFAIAITDLGKGQDVTGIACKLMESVALPLSVAGHDIFSSASIGIGLSASDGGEIDELMRNAAAALHYARAEGGANFHFYAPEMNARASARFALDTDLHRALSADEFTMHYQPKVNLRNGVLAGAEALIRWQHPRLGMVSPANFIPQAEESGLILQIGQWVIATVCAQLRNWVDAGVPVAPVALNVSARQFKQKDLAAILRQSLQSNALDPKLIELEITESALMEDLNSAAAILHELKSTGVKLTLDDFGTGYSSLSYLQRFPIDNVKIDQSFVRDLTVNPGDAVICRSVIGLAHELQLHVIAEGVETEGQMNYLRRHHCDDIQGYYFSRPLPAAEYEALVRRKQKLELQDAGSSPGRTLLIVDDETYILSALRRTFRHEGFQLLIADNARDGLELLATHDVQVVLSDQRMPHMCGTEFLARVRDLYPDTIRLILSGYADLETVVGAVNRGTLFKFLTKPWDDDALRAQLREAFLYHDLRVGSAKRVQTGE